MALMIWHDGTGTVMDPDSCKLVDVPNDIEDAEEWIRANDPQQHPLYVEETKELLDASEDVLVAFSEGVSWSDDQRRAYEALHRAGNKFQMYNLRKVISSEEI